MARDQAPGTVKPEAGRNPGYAEPQPQDRRDAQEPAAPAQPSRGNPDAGSGSDAGPGRERKPAD